ncbi:ankyrin repeat domain-containing protein [Streptomyces sp. NPDC047315]|uniref:ankyrin repeat domain-containing protein n=1 Tax=Streptomyces sp. NPDC047315 TaxID=3155142 RepID=UPI0033D1B4B1
MNASKASKASNASSARNDNTALLDAAKRGDATAARAAIDAGADVEARDQDLRTPLLLAALGDHVEVARALVAAGGDPNAQDARHDSAWLVTGVTGSVAMMRVLLPAGPDVTLRNRFGGVSVIPASERGHVAYVRAVVSETDIDVNHVNDLGWTALLEAVLLGDGGAAHQQVVKILLAAGARPDLADADGVTPLQHAHRRGFAEIVALLKDAQ